MIMPMVSERSPTFRFEEGARERRIYPEPPVRSARATSIGETGQEIVRPSHRPWPTDERTFSLGRQGFASLLHALDGISFGGDECE